MKKPIFIVAVICMALSGCFYDNYKDLYPAASFTNDCDTTSTITYSKQISAVISGYCISCHSQGIANGNTLLDSYNAVQSAAVSGKLLGTILHQGGYPAMPPNSQMDACSIREIQIWINNNYPE